MALIRWRMLWLLLWLTLFFNIERLDLDLETIDTINLPTVVYPIGIASAIAAITPTFQRRPLSLLIALALGLYAAALLLQLEPLFGDIHTYLTLTCALLLSVTVVLAYTLGRSLSEFMQAVEDMTFSSRGGLLRDERAAQDIVQREMISSRRRQRPLSLVMLQADASSMNLMLHRLIQDVQRLMIQRYVLVSVTRVLARHLRRTDIIVEGPQPGRLVLLAPDTSAEDAQLLGERLAQVARERVGIDASYSVATFPDQALTYEELLNVAEQRLTTQGAGHPPQLEPEEQVTQLAEQHAHEQLAPAAVALEAGEQRVAGQALK